MKAIILIVCGLMVSLQAEAAVFNEITCAREKTGGFPAAHFVHNFKKIAETSSGRAVYEESGLHHNFPYSGKLLELKGNQLTELTFGGQTWEVSQEKNKVTLTYERAGSVFGDSKGMPGLRDVYHCDVVQY